MYTRTRVKFNLFRKQQKSVVIARFPQIILLTSCVETITKLTQKYIRLILIFIKTSIKTFEL